MTNNFCCINCGKYEGVKKVIKTYEIRGNDRNLNNHFEVRDLLVTYCGGFSKFTFLLTYSVQYILFKVTKSNLIGVKSLCS